MTDHELAAVDTITALPLCPCCVDHFRSTLPESFPHALSCGHVLCFQCADAVLMASHPVCVLCQAVIDATSVADHSMAEYGEAVTREAGVSGGDLESFVVVGTSPKAGEVDGSDDGFLSIMTGSTALSDALACSTGDGSNETSPDYTFQRSKLSQLRSSCERGALFMGSCAETIASLKTRAIVRKAASVEAFQRLASEAKAAIDAHVSHVMRECDKALEGVVKTLDAQVDELSVSAGQLACAAQICLAALRRCDTSTAIPGPLLSSVATTTCAESVGTIFDGRSVVDVVNGAICSAERVLKVVKPYNGPRVSTRVEVKPPMSWQDVQYTLDRQTRVCLGVEASRCSKSGAGTKVFHTSVGTGSGSGSCVVNVFELVVKDTRGQYVDSISEEDIDVRFSVLGRDNPATKPDTTTTTTTTATTTTIVPVESDGNAIVAKVLSIRCMDDGRVEVEYVVLDGDVSVLGVDVGVCGVYGIAGGPWRVSRWSVSTGSIVCEAKGRYVIGYKNIASGPKICFDVNADETLMAIVPSKQPQLYVCDVPDGSVQHMLPWGKLGATQSPKAVRFTPVGTLAALIDSRTMTEFGIDGSGVVRSFVTIDEASNFVVDGEGRYIVSNHQLGNVWAPAPQNAVSVYSPDGKLLFRLGECGDHYYAPRTVAVSPSGGLIAFVSPNRQSTYNAKIGRVAVFRSNGALMRMSKCSSDDVPQSITFLNNDELIGCCSSDDMLCVIPVSSLSESSVIPVSKRVKAGVGSWEFHTPLCTVVRGCRVYVLDKYGNITVYE